MVDDAHESDGRVVAGQLFETEAEGRSGGQSGDGDHEGLIAPFAPQLRYGSLPDNHLEFGRCAAAYQLQIDGPPDARGSEQPHDFTNAIDWPPVPGLDNVADEQSGAPGRPGRINAHDQNAVGLPFQALTMSPTSNPARPEGPAGSMLTTRTPRPLLDPCDPLDSCPSCMR